MLLPTIIVEFIDSLLLPTANELKNEQNSYVLLLNKRCWSIDFKREAAKHIV